MGIIEDIKSGEVETIGSMKCRKDGKILDKHSLKELRICLENGDLDNPYDEE